MTSGDLMGMTSWDFTTISIISTMCLTALVVAFGVMRHRSKMKELEIEALRVQKANLQSEVNHAVDERMEQYKDRMQVLEAIVTSKNYDLNEKISKIK